MVTLVIEVVLHALSLQNDPPEPLVLRATVTVLAGFDGLPLESRVCTVISGEHAPAATLKGDVVKASWAEPEMVIEGWVVESDTPVAVAFKV